MLGSVLGELGLRNFLEPNWHQLVVTSSKDDADSVLDRESPDADIVIFDGRPIPDEYRIVQAGQLAGVGAHAYSKRNATGGT